MKPTVPTSRGNPFTLIILVCIPWPHTTSFSQKGLGLPNSIEDTRCNMGLISFPFLWIDLFTISIFAMLPREAQLVAAWCSPHDRIVTRILETEHTRRIKEPLSPGRGCSSASRRSTPRQQVNGPYHPHKGDVSPSLPELVSATK
jgi:hypothetical protein